MRLTISAILIALISTASAQDVSAQAPNTLDGGFGQPVWFDVPASATTKPLVSGSTFPETYKDRIYTTSSSSTLTGYDWSPIIRLGDLSPPTVTGSSTNPSVITTGSYVGDWTPVGTGTSGLVLTGSGRGSVQIDVTVSSGTYVGRNLYGYLSGSVAEDCTSQIDSRLAVSSTANGITYWTGSSINSSCWVNSGTAVDFSSRAVWNSKQGYKRGATLIGSTRDVVIVAKHYTHDVGTTLQFASSGTTATGTVASVLFLDGGQDIALEKLTAPLPASITPAKVLPADWASKWCYPTWSECVSSGYSFDVPAVHFNQFNEARVCELGWNANYGQTVYYGAGPYDYISAHFPIQASRQPWARTVIQGDSGQPSFLIINGEAVLLYTFWGVYAGPFVSEFIPEINAGMATLGSSGTLTPVDLSSFVTP